MLYRLFILLKSFFYIAPSPQDVYANKLKEVIQSAVDNTLDAKVKAYNHREKQLHHQKMAEYYEEVLKLPNPKLTISQEN